MVRNPSKAGQNSKSKPFPFSHFLLAGPVMVDLFFDKVLVKNNKDRDELDTEREIILRLQNRILMLFFGSGDCERCQEFAPTLKDFFKKLTDEFYVERSAQLVLLYISLDTSEEQQDKFLKELPKRCLFLNFEDPYRKYGAPSVPASVECMSFCGAFSKKPKKRQHKI